jgi:hypothetical protein
LLVVVLVVMREGMREIRGSETGAAVAGGEWAMTKECSEVEWCGEEEADEHGGDGARWV